MWLVQRFLYALDRDPTASTKSIASSVGSRRSLEGKHKEPTLLGLRLSVPPGQLVGICGQVQFILLLLIYTYGVRAALLLAVILCCTLAAWQMYAWQTGLAHLMNALIRCCLRLVTM